MKKKIKIISFIFVFAISLFLNNVWAASFSVGASSTNLTVGSSGTVTVNGSGVAGGPITVTSSNPSVVSVGTFGSSGWVENNSISATMNAKSAGTAVLTIKGTVANLSNSSDESNVTKTITITVKEKTSPPVVNPPSNTNSNTKSNNSYLKSLGVNVEGLTPTFNKSKLNYTLTVRESVNDIVVNATSEDSKAKVSVTGNKGLIIGDNTINITVTAQNGGKRTYKIVVTKTNNPELSNSLLENLIVENTKFKTEFSSEVLEYECEDIEYNIDSLTLLVFTQNKNAKYEVIGNENLKAGENIITIKVTSEDGKTVKEYKIKVNKKEGEPEVITTVEQDPLQNDTSFFSKVKSFFKKCYAFFMANGLLILLISLCIVEFVQIIYLYKKVKSLKGEKFFSIGSNKEKNNKEEKEDIQVDTSRRRNNTTSEEEQKG